MVLSWKLGNKSLYSITIIHSLALVVSFILRVGKWGISVEFFPRLIAILLARVVVANQNWMKGVIWRVKLCIWTFPHLVMADHCMKAVSTIVYKIAYAILMSIGLVCALFLCILLFFLHSLV